MEKEKAAAAALAATIAATGVAADATFDDPGDILQNTKVDPVVEHIGDGDSGDGSGVQDEEKGKKSARESARESILKLPIVVRAVLVLPIWVIGNMITTAVGFLFAALSPVFNAVLSTVIMALVIIAAFTIGAKIMFPDLPLKKILNKQTLKWALVAAVLASVVDGVLSVTWTSYAAFKYLIKGVLTLIPLGILITWFTRKENKRRAKLAKEEEKVRHKEITYTSLGRSFTIRDPENK